MRRSVKAALLFLAFCACLLLASCFFKSSYINVLRQNWGIALPSEEVNEIFSYSQPSPHGDGVRYHIIDYPAGDETAQTQRIVSQLEKVFGDGSLPTEAQTLYADQLLDAAGIPEEYIPDWQQYNLVYLMQKDGSELYLFYCGETGTVYVVESFL